MLLEVKDLTTYFFIGAGVVRAVDGVSYDVREGETVALVGESGCGKTVSALSVMRLVAAPAGRIVAGQILFKGRDLLALDEEGMRRVRGREIGMVFQEPMTSLNPVLSIGRQVTETVEIHLRMTPAQARARGVTIQAQILELMKDLSRRLGVAMLIITHNLGVVARYADRVNVMYAGKIIERGTARESYANPPPPLPARAPALGAARGRAAEVQAQPHRGSAAGSDAAPGGVRVFPAL